MKRLIAILFITLTLGSCVVYDPYAYGATTQQRFDRSWSAAMDAMNSQDVKINAQDRGAGIIRGNRDGIVVTAQLKTLADGSIQVRFDQSDATNADPGLIHRVTDSYNWRMGR